MKVHASSAVLSDDSVHRYRLSRDLALYPQRTCAFIMFNCSTADAEKNDPTIRRGMGYAQGWGYGRYVAGNLFAYRETVRARLNDLPYEYIVGPDNDRWLHYIADEADRIVCAWGKPSEKRLRDMTLRRAQEVVNILGEHHQQLYVLGLTKDNFPLHPLYMRADLLPVRWVVSKQIT